jgi:ABC-type branched-subunit amino acid transport system ATPase component
VTGEKTPTLRAEAVSVRFGGLQAVADLSLRAESGTITGLIGPNGAGKTTTFNAIAGAVPMTGTTHLGERCLDRLDVRGRAQAGLGRTFQRMELLDTMQVLDNVAMGPELQLAGRSLVHHLFGARRERMESLEAARHALERCGILPLADAQVTDLSTGQRRLVELARAIASDFRFLILDEPSSGLDARETASFGQILEGIVAERGIGILLVEHDMALVRSVCSYIFVLDFGMLLAEGPADEVLGSDVVRAAYLGTEADAGGPSRRTR